MTLYTEHLTKGINIHLLDTPRCYKMVLFYQDLDIKMVLLRIFPHWQFLAARYVVRYPEVKFYTICAKSQDFVDPELVTGIEEYSHIQFRFWSKIPPVNFRGQLTDANFIDELCDFLEKMMNHIYFLIAINDLLLRLVEDSELAGELDEAKKKQSKKIDQ